MANASSPDTITPEERAAYEQQEQDRAMAEARARSAAAAGEFLTSKGVAGYGPPPPPPAAPPMQAPTPPAPQEPPLPSGLGMWAGTYGAEEQAPASVAPQPWEGRGWRFENGQMVDAPPDQLEANRPKPSPAAPPPQAPGGDAPSPPQPASPPPGGGGGVVIPGGFYPDRMETQAKLGKPVPDEAKLAFGAASGLQMRAAEEGAAADKTFFDQQKGVFDKRVAAAEASRADMARLQLEKDAEINRRLGEIETLNKQARVRTEDVFNDRVLAGRALSALFTGLGFASGVPSMAFTGAVMGGTMNSLVNADIDSKLKAKDSTSKLAQHQTDLLGMYLKKFGDKERAIQSYKLAYWDSLGASLDSFEAEHKGNLNQAALDDRRAMILNQRAETVSRIAAREEADIMQSYAQKYHMPQVVGGGLSIGAGAADDTRTVTLSDGTSYEVATKELHKDAIERIDSYDKLKRMNNEISALRKKASELHPFTDREEHLTAMTRLEDLEQRKLKFIETAAKQGVLREGEYPRAQAMTGHATTGLGTLEQGHPVADVFMKARRKAADAALASQTKEWDDDQREMLRSMNAHVVDRKYAQDPRTGEKRPAASYTGQDVKPSPALAPRGSKPMDRKERLNVQGEPDRKVAPYSPTVIRPLSPPASSTKRSHHKK